MRSLIILEVEHDDTDDLQSLVESLKPSTFHSPYRVTILDYAVRVDVPTCFVLDDGVWANEGQRELDPFFDTAFEPRSWEDRGIAEAGSLMDTHGIAYNRESYFR